MVDEGRSEAVWRRSRPWEDRSGRAAGTILATAVARRGHRVPACAARARKKSSPPSQLARLARDWAGSDSIEAGRDFLMDKVLPELKPALLSALSEIEDVVDQAFRRIEKNIKKL